MQEPVKNFELHWFISQDSSFEECALFLQNSILVAKRSEVELCGILYPKEVFPKNGVKQSEYDYFFLDNSRNTCLDWSNVTKITDLLWTQ